MSNDPPHRPAMAWDIRGGIYRPVYECVYCGKPIQRRGLFRRWRHVQ